MNVKFWMAGVRKVIKSVNRPCVYVAKFIYVYVTLSANTQRALSDTSLDFFEPFLVCDSL